MNHAKRNRNKARLRRNRTQRAGAIIHALRNTIKHLQSDQELARCYLDEAIRRARNAEDALRDREIKDYENRVMPSKPPAPYKYWYEVFMISKNTIMRSGFNSRLVFPAGLDDINATASSRVSVINVSLQDILFGTLCELSDCVIPKNLIRVIEIEIKNPEIAFGGASFNEGVIRYEGQPVDLKLMYQLATIKQLYQR